MNSNTEEEIVAYMRNASPLDVMDIETLFDIYATNEIVKYSDLFREHSSFVKLIEREVVNCQFAEEEDAAVVKSLARQKIKHFLALNSVYFRRHRHHQENWAKQIEALVGFDKDVKILEVGSGEIPYASLIMAKDGYNITSIGQFELPQACLDELHLKSHRGLFTETTKVKDYDVVVGRRPCTAINAMVTNCAKENVPYMIRLCGCALPTQDIYDWRWILKRVDHDIEFADAYAYNMKSRNFDPAKTITEIIGMDEDRSRT